jgi:thiamine-phosphate pyrophosphorylase
VEALETRAPSDRTRDWRRAALSRARLYLICDSAPGGRRLEEVLPAVLGAGVEVVQLRDKRLDDGALLGVATSAARLAREAGALFIVNDRPDLARSAGADGVHLGQDDVDPGTARSMLGPDPVIGISTHTPAQIDAAADANYLGVGPVHPTPTKPGRPGVGLALVRYAAAHARSPFFAIGGLNEDNVDEVLAAGARRVAVVRAIADADDPVEAARRLRARIERAARPDHTVGERAHGSA